MADTTIVFIGIRLDVCDNDLEMLEEETHPSIVQAKQAGVQYFWDNFGLPGERYCLFIGKLLGKLGVENSSDVQIGAEQFAQLAADVTSRLARAGFSEAPFLYLQFQPDS